MKWVNSILNKLNGLYYSQEYLCLAKESFQQPLHVYLVTGKHIIKDITNHHLFVGYSPLVFAFPFFHQTDLERLVNIDVVFSHEPLEPNAVFSKKDAIASLALRMIRKQVSGNHTIFYYEGTRGQHRFLSVFHQFIIHLNNQLNNKKPGNIFLKGNLHKQVEIAYAVPRNISLVTVSQAGLFNLFPTDLHGQINEEHYIISLRHGGKACKQVETAGRIVISQMHCQAYKTVYSLGKNHMQELKPKDNFPFGESFSTLFQLPLPQLVLYYRELELMASFAHGIHRFLLFKILTRQPVKDEPATLAHIHNCYASWRHNKGLAGNYLLR